MSKLMTLSKLSNPGRCIALLAVAAGLSLAGCASEDYQAKYEEQQKLNLDLSNSNEELKQQRAEAAAKCEQLGQVLKQNDVETQKARQNAEALAKQNEELRVRLASKESAAVPAPASGATGAGIDDGSLRALVVELKKELGKQADIVSLTKDGNIDITLASDVTFASGSADLTEAGKKSLKSISALLKGRFAPYHIRVEGHTDSTPLVHKKDAYKDNFGLGSARSLSVLRFMETDLGIEPTRLMSASRGEHDPIADEKTESGRKKNRRVEVVVVIPHDAAVSLAK